MIRGTRALSAAKPKKAQVERRQEHIYDRVSVSSRRNAHFRMVKIAKMPTSKSHTKNAISYCKTQEIVHFDKQK